VLITYNRSELLKKTLSSLSLSPFRDCEIVVLNNASPDDTLAVCESFKSHFADYTVITHPANIGGNGNILRSYEYGKGYYKWILCDDDVLHLDSAGDLIEAIQQRKADMIRISDVGVIRSERGTLRTVESLLHDKLSHSFYSFGFVPSIIFKSDAVKPYIQYGYKYLHTHYQQLFILMKAFGALGWVYTTKTPLLTRGPGSTGIGSEILLYQMLSLEALPTKKARKTVLRRRRWQNPLGYHFGYTLLILGDLKIDRPRFEILRVLLKTIYHANSWFGKFVLLLNGFAILLPVKTIYRVLGRELKVNKKEIEMRGNV